MLHNPPFGMLWNPLPGAQLPQDGGSQGQAVVRLPRKAGLNSALYLLGTEFSLTFSFAPRSGFPPALKMEPFFLLVYGESQVLSG